MIDEYNGLAERVAQKAATQLSAPLSYERRKILLNLETPAELERAQRFRTLEVETTEWIESFEPGDVFFDVGANIGLFSLLAAAQQKDHRVVAFEPAFSSYHSLVRSLLLNGFTQSVIPLQMGLADVSGLSTFNYHSLDPGSAKSVVGEAVNWRGDAFKPVAVQHVVAFRMDHAIATFSLPFPNHIKIDVDGIEFKVIAGAEQTLADPRVRSIMVEANSLAMEDQLTEVLSRHQFKLVRRQAKEIKPGEFKTRNNFFERA